MASLPKAQTEEHDDSHLPSVVWLPPEEARRQFDEMAREKVGMSGDEFIRRLDADEFLDLPDDFEHSAYAELAILSSFGRYNRSSRSARRCRHDPCDSLVRN